jgi:LacI family transcriptional regulator
MSTIYEVAKMANVSRTTVSRYINSSGYVSEEAKAEIKKAIKALNYRPNRMAQGLNTNTSKNIALVVGDIKNPVIADYVRCMETVAFKNDYNIIICDTDFSLEKEVRYIRMLVDKQIDGIIIAPCGKGKEHLEEVIERNIPMVFITRSVPGLPVDSVMFENINGSYKVVNYLIEKGHTRIGLIGRGIDLDNPNERRAGYELALKSNGIPVVPELVICEGTTRESGFKSMEKLMKMPDPPTAVFATVNALVCGALRYCRKEGISILEDVELACFERFIDEDEITAEPLWAANELPFRELGALATQMLFDRVLHKMDGPPRQIVLVGEMTVPESGQPV